MIRIQLIGKFEVFDSEGVALKLRSHRALYALLAVARNKPVPRRDLMFAMWPDVPIEIAQNRLRVSLSNLRKFLGAALIESVHGVSLSRDEVETDVDSLHAELNDIENEVDEQRELERLEALVPTLRETFVNDLSEAWVEEHRLEWAETALQTLERISSLAWKHDAFRLAANCASASLVHEPFDDGLWISYLKAKVRLGESADAMKEFAVVRKRRQSDEDSDFGEEVLAFAKQIRLGQYTVESNLESALTLVENEFLIHLIEKYLEHDPVSLAGLLGTQVYRQEQLKFSEASQLILGRLLPRLERGSMPWFQVHLARLEASGIVNDAPHVLTMWNDIQDLEVPSQLKWLYLNITSFSRFQMRDYEGALRDINEAIENNSENPILADRLLTNKASYMWHLGDFEEAEELYKRSTAACLQFPGDPSNARIAINTVNTGFSLIMQGRLEEALVQLEAAVELMQKYRLEAAIAMAYSAIGYIRFVVLGEKEALLQTCQGIKMSYHLRHERSQQIALDYVAAAFAHAGEQEMACSVIEYATEWRNRTSHGFSVAEAMLRDRTLAQIGSAAGSDSNLLSLSAPEALCEVVKKLREIATADDLVLATRS